MESAFGQKYGIENFFESHDTIKDYSFMAEMYEKKAFNERDLEEYTNSLNEISLERNTLSKNCVNIYGVEKNYYETRINKLDSKKGNLEKKISEFSNDLNSLNKKLEKEKNFLEKYSVISLEILNEKELRELGKTRITQFKVIGGDSCWGVGEINLPKFVFYDIDSSEVCLTAFSNFNHDQKIVSSEISTNSLNDPYNDVIRSGMDSVYSAVIEIKSNFHGRVSELSREIDSAKKVFDSVYVVARANWQREVQDYDLDREEDDFMIVGKRRGIDRLYFVGEKVNENKIIVDKNFVDEDWENCAGDTFYG